MIGQQPIAVDTTEGELFRLLVENIKDYAIFVTDPEGRVRSWNPGAERLLGYSASEIIGQPASLFSTPENNDEQVVQREMDKAVETGRGEDDRWHVRKDGSRFWSGGTITPLWDEEHRLRGFAKIMRDRTAQKHGDDALKDALACAERAEQGRREVESRFTSLVKHVKDHAIFTMGLGGDITSWNEAAERILGYSEDEKFTRRRRRVRPTTCAGISARAVSGFGPLAL
jgi:PAS domain S-box-containing protein